jgi:hypothetical protein
VLGRLIVGILNSQINANSHVRYKLLAYHPVVSLHSHFGASAGR